MESETNQIAKPVYQAACPYCKKEYFQRIKGKWVFTKWCCIDRSNAYLRKRNAPRICNRSERCCQNGRVCRHYELCLDQMESTIFHAGVECYDPRPYLERKCESNFDQETFINFRQGGMILPDDYFNGG